MELRNRAGGISACVRSRRSPPGFVKQEQGRRLGYRSSSLGSRRLLLSLLLLAAWESGHGQLRYAVPEEAQHGTFVGRLAQDLGLELAELVPRLFRVASKERGELLEVNVQNGILFVNARVDREELCGRSAECSLHLEVIVDRPLRVFHVEVEVEDINDNPPVFSVAEQKILIPESRLLDSRFPLEGASDADVGENAALTYKLSSNEFFSLDTINKKDRGKFPVLVLRKALDREENPQLKLLLTATDGGKPELTASVSLLIVVLDANDNAPVFDRSIYEVKMYENQANQTLLIRLNASDADEGLNKELVYSFSSLVPPLVRRKFVIDERTGEIRVNDAVDFEESNNYEIHVDVSDKGYPPMAGHCTVLVEILDENDNSPEIVLTTLSLPVKEDAPVGTVIALVSVSDRDAGANGQVSCSLPPHLPFKLASTFRNYYSLVLDSALDREATAGYQVVVTARDGGSPPRWATASVWVEVADVNDNAPVFAQAEYTVSVRENNAPGAHICTVSARDADAQENARVSYALVERRVGERALSSLVSVHAQSGRVHALQPLDHEELALLQFQVSARDAGAPARGSNASLQLFVLDENDNAPALLGPAGGGARSHALARSAGAGHVLTKVRALDADSGYNAWLAYELQPAAAGARSPFRVGLYTGEVSTTRALDEADAPRQRLVVLVRDHGEPALTATATLLVSLVDGAPSPKLSARASAGRVGAEASPLDVNASLMVAICAVSGLLVLTLLLWVALRCCGAARSEGACAPGKPVLVCSSAVGSWSSCRQRRPGLCSADGPPKADLMAFSPSLTPCPVPNIGMEDQLVGGDESGKGASDADVGTNAYLSYHLSPNDYFSLEVPTQDEQVKPLELVLKKHLDREVDPELRLVLKATDGGKPELTGTVALRITVLDANDNAPVFDKAVYRVKLVENARNGTLVIRPNASDVDEGSNGHILFSFGADVSPKTRATFHIDPSSGEIKVNGNIDFEDTELWKIQVEAVDKGNPPMFGHCTILVEVLDVNDNAPELLVTSLSLPIREDAPVGTVIALVSVSDRDAGANGQVSCSLPPHLPFKLASTFRNYYSLVLDSALDREATAGYQVVVTARDGGSPPRGATASVWVEVADVNDNAPVFAQAEYTVSVRENNAPGAHICTVSARDADAQENARVSYALVERRVGERALSSLVSVHAQSGRVHALQPLDHEELALLQFQVSARDAGAPARGSNASLQLFVLDENDNAPALLGPAGGGARSHALARSAGAGHVLTKVRALDADSGYNAWLAYELQPAAAGARSPFRVGLYTGEVSTTRALDEADAPRQRLVVLVRDHGEPALTATATLLVSLVDGAPSPKLSARASAGRVGAEASPLDVNASLMVAICAVSGLLVLTLLLWGALRCCGAARSEGACAPGKPVLVCSSAVGSWSSCRQRRPGLCSAEGPPKADLMAFSPGLPPSSGCGDNGVQQESFENVSTVTLGCI
ncbi:protocadherin alpha-10-like [Perognathus longimembris pacificus]|uniref:protocadherin alpha-10-like n=1 Tax=Perognathus longimembris pacificus TaxID=214514 RepID=UPI002018CEB1|nr:protocadherin alpha-10-like [Perognathus longimembris pacificus]